MRQEFLCLKIRLPLPLLYTGILGARQRTDRLLDRLEAEGHLVTGDQQERLFSPAGLDLGSETPDEVALSILAEMQAVIRGRRGGSLSELKVKIHNR